MNRGPDIPYISPYYNSTILYHCLLQEANRTKNYELLEQQIRDELEPFIYNGGKGKWFHVRDLVRIREGQVEPGDVEGVIFPPDEEPKIGEIGTVQDHDGVTI